MSDDFLSDEQANIEQRFRELEQDAELERLRDDKPNSTTQSDTHDDAATNANGQQHRSDPPKATGDPLADAKAALDDDKKLERYVLALCPHCDAKNRASLSKLRSANPTCGGCKRALSFTKL